MLVFASGTGWGVIIKGGSRGTGSPSVSSFFIDNGLSVLLLHQILEFLSDAFHGTPSTFHYYICGIEVIFKSCSDRMSKRFKNSAIMI